MYGDIEIRKDNETRKMWEHSGVKKWEENLEDRRLMLKNMERYLKIIFYID